MLSKSIVTHSTIDKELFPLLVVRCCISEAEESLNGPRFCAQDKITGGAYEVRCFPLGCTSSSSRFHGPDLEHVRRQQWRIDELMRAAARDDLPDCVDLPIDVYMQEQPSTGSTFVASVSHFGGLSLGDLLRSGWGLIDEHVFDDIIRAVEVYGCYSHILPPHGNLSPDALKQKLIIRYGATEARQPSRWVVGDWLLPFDDCLTSFDADAFVGGVEWVLHSAFSQLHISSGMDGKFLSKAVVEARINGTVERIREALLRNTSHLPLSLSPIKSLANGRRSSVDGASSAQTCSPRCGHRGDSFAPSREGRASFSPPAIIPGVDSEEDVQGGLYHMSVKEKLLHHQSALRKEQMIINKYRRKNAPLPPRPHPSSASPPSGISPDSDGDEYELHCLTSPVQARRSILLSQYGPVDVPDLPTDDQIGLARQLLSNVSSTSTKREDVLDSVVTLTSLVEERRQVELQAKLDEKQAQRESLRALLCRNAAMGANRARHHSLASGTMCGVQEPTWDRPGKHRSASPSPSPSPYAREGTKRGMLLTEQEGSLAHKGVDMLQAGQGRRRTLSTAAGSNKKGVVGGRQALHSPLFDATDEDLKRDSSCRALVSDRKPSTGVQLQRKDRVPDTRFTRAGLATAFRQTVVDRVLHTEGVVHPQRVEKVDRAPQTVTSSSTVPPIQRLCFPDGTPLTLQNLRQMTSSGRHSPRSSGGQPGHLAVRSVDNMRLLQTARVEDFRTPRPVVKPFRRTHSASPRNHFDAASPRGNLALGVPNQRLQTSRPLRSVLAGVCPRVAQRSRSAKGSIANGRSETLSTGFMRATRSSSPVMSYRAVSQKGDRKPSCQKPHSNGDYHPRTVDGQQVNPSSRQRPRAVTHRVRSWSAPVSSARAPTRQRGITPGHTTYRRHVVQ